MRRTAVLLAATLAVALILAASAQPAFAYPGVSFTVPCSTCHSGAGPNPVAVQVSNNGTTATYNVTGGGLEWALFSGGTRIAGQPGATGQFTINVGTTYTLFAVNGYPGPLGQTTVLASAPTPQFTVTASAGPHGTISPGSVMVNSGGSVAYTITADAGYHVADVLVDGVSVGAVTAYNFVNVTAVHSIAVTFVQDVLNVHTLTPSAGAGGSISPATAQTVVDGSDFAFMIAANPGFHISDVLVDGISVGAVGSYTFANVTADHTVAAQFAPDVSANFMITPQAGANGSISPVTVQSVAQGGSATFVFTPDLGYHVEAVAVDGVQVPTALSYTFTNVTADHVIAVSFSNDPEAAVETSVSIRATDYDVRRGTYVRVPAALRNRMRAPAFGCVLKYYVKSPGATSYRLLAARTVDPVTGLASLRVRLTRHGYYYFRVIFSGTDDFLASRSRTIRIRVR